MNAIQEKPQYDHVKDTLARTLKLGATLQKFADDEGARKARIERVIGAIRKKAVRGTLESLDIEQINQGKQGIRVSLLKSNGIENVWQAYSLSYSRLVRINGIGEQSTQKIKDITAEIARSAESTSTVKLSPDDRSTEMRELICQLYPQVAARQAIEEATQLHAEYQGAVTDALKYAKKARNGLSWLFTSKKNRAYAIDRISWLDLLLSSGVEEAANDAILAYKNAKRIPSVKCREDFLARPAAYIAALSEYLPGAVAGASVYSGLPAELVAAVNEQPADLRHLKATLRGYQLFGCKYILRQGNVLLGDEMGLGKTVQAIAAMAALKAEGHTHFMVVCPASVLVNWCREVKEHSDLVPVKIHGDDDDAVAAWVEGGGVAVTTYESISRFELPQDFRFSMLTADEAHYVKNPEAQRTAAMRELLKSAGRVLFMTGTPLENRVDEMCFIVSMLSPSVATELSGIKYLSTAPQFREKLAPVYLRRTRDDVLKELPELMETAEWCDLKAEEARCYRDAVYEGNFMAMRQVSWQLPDISSSSKAERLLEICEEAAEENRKVIVFSFFRNTVSKVCALLEGRAMEPITGSVSPDRRQQILDEFKKAPGGSVLVCQVQAGGTGLNIQAASVVIFCEPQLKPSIENQAISRAYRMGQLRSVLVYRLLCEDCIDERIMELLRQKQAVFDSFADRSVIGEEQLEQNEAAWINGAIAEEKRRLAG